MFDNIAAFLKDKMELINELMDDLQKENFTKFQDLNIC